MASRNLIHNSDEEVVPKGLKQKNMGEAEGGRNRRALGDIGNLVTDVHEVDGKPITQESLLVTRTQEAAAENNLKCNVVKLDVPAIKKVRGKKPTQKATLKQTKPREVIDISPDTKEKEIEKKRANNKKCNAVRFDVPVVKAVGGKKPTEKATLKQTQPGEVIDISPDTEEKEIEKRANTKRASEVSSARRKAPTLTATLTARSKAACGLRNKPDEQIVDIDAADVNNELAVVEYIDDMYKFYKLAESETRVHDYIDSQPEISRRMRAVLVDWLVEVHNKFELNQETLYLTINIVDRYLAKKITSRKELQLVGLGSMLVASKYEEIWAPEVNDFVRISNRDYSHEQVLVMEKRILGELEWYLTVPTPYVFLVRYIKASVPDSVVDENLAFFLAELGMMNYETIIYCYSMIAASAVYAARCTMNKSPAWTETLKMHTGFSESQLTDCAKLLVSFHAAESDEKAEKLRVIQLKYSSSERGFVALLPPAKSLLDLAGTP